jgi:hypothetical protein
MRTLLQIFQQFNLVELTKFARSVFNRQDEQDYLFEMISIRSHLLNLTKTDVSDSYYSFVEIISYKTKSNCLSERDTKRWSHIDLIWFSWSDPIWFNSSTSFYNTHDHVWVPISHTHAGTEEKFSVYMGNSENASPECMSRELCENRELENREGRGLDENQTIRSPR